MPIRMKLTITMGFGGRHAGPLGVAQHHWAVVGGNHPQQAEADFNRLYALTVAGNFGDHRRGLVRKALFYASICSVRDKYNFPTTTQGGDMRAVLGGEPRAGQERQRQGQTQSHCYFANQGKKTTLCDLDRQQSALRWMVLRDLALPPVTGYSATRFLELPKRSRLVIMD